VDGGSKHNIIILNHHAGAPDTGGGGRHYELGKFLSEHGNMVTVVASSYSGSMGTYCVPHEVNIRKFNDNFTFIRLRTKPAYNSNLGRFINYYDYAFRASRLDCFEYEPDVVIASSVHPLAWIAGHRLSKKYGAKFIVEVRDLWPLSMYEDFEGLKRTLVFSYFESLEKKYYDLADAIVTTAPFAYEYMELKYGIDRNKVYYIPHGLDIEEFDRNASLNEEILDPELVELLNNKFCVTYTGSLSRSEGLPTFVQAAKYLRDLNDIKLVIVGSGSEQERLARIIDKENLENVAMIPAQPKKSIPLTLKKSKILFCGLMEREAFKYGISKNKFYDYMAAQKPIIFASSVRGSLIDIAESGITIEPDNPRQLAITIRYVYDNIDTIGKEYGNNGRTYVEYNHSVDNIASQFLNVMETC
jgi:glycosyltransferase involved in cell wall biosynthesis